MQQTHDLLRMFEKNACLFRSVVFDGLIAEVEIDAQHAAIAQPPACADGAMAQHIGAQGLGTGQARDDLFTADFQQLPIQRLVGLLLRTLRFQAWA